MMLPCGTVWWETCCIALQFDQQGAYVGSVKCGLSLMLGTLIPAYSLCEGLTLRAPVRSQKAPRLSDYKLVDDVLVCESI